MSIAIQHGRLYAAALSPRRGSEPGKVRPVLVIQTDLLNAVEHPSTWILPCLKRRLGTLPKSVLAEVKTKLALLADLRR